jgi:hypothetical protein
LQLAALHQTAPLAAGTKVLLKTYLMKGDMKEPQYQQKVPEKASQDMIAN